MKKNNNANKKGYGVISKFRINNKRKRNAFKDDMFNVKSEEKSINTKNVLDNIKQENIILEAERGLTDQKILNSTYKNELSKINTAVDLNDKLASNKKERIKKDYKKGKQLARRSTVASIISGITTCISLIYTEQDLGKQIFMCCAVLIFCVLVNCEIKTLDTFKKYFFEKDFDGVLGLCFKIFILIAYTCFSIDTNLTFWKNYFDGLALYTFAIGFDALSIEMARDSFRHINLLYNKKTIDSINEVFDDVKNREEKNSVDQKKNIAV